jgi:hypothetical protein
METAMSVEIWKFPLQPGSQELPLPIYSRVLSVAAQGDKLMLWAVVHPSNPSMNLLDRITWYDEWRGSLDGKPTLWIRWLVNAFGCRIDLHKMVGPDDERCFHTHPAYAIRLILSGGYVEELENGVLQLWLPGMLGIVKPTLCHRVANLVNQRVSYSLWIRFRKTAEVALRGDGWQKSSS